MAEQEAPEEEREGEKKKKPLLLIIIAANVVLLGAAVPFVLMRGDDEPPAKAGGDGHGAEDGHAQGDEGQGDDHTPNPSSKDGLSGPLIGFNPIVVNLNEPEGARYLKIELHVQLASEKKADTVNDTKPIVRDVFIRELSDLNFRQTMGNKAKLAIKRRLLRRFNEVMGSDTGIDIHITQFVVQ